MDTSVKGPDRPGSPVQELFFQTRSLQTRFRQIKPGDPTEEGEVQKIREEAQRILTETTPLLTAGSVPKKWEKELHTIRDLCTSISESSTLKSCHLREQALRTSFSLLTNRMRGKIDQGWASRFETDILAPAVAAEEQLDILERQVAETLKAPPSVVEGDRRLILMRRIHEDRFILAELSKKIEESIADNTERVLRERGSQDLAIKDAFRRGEGAAVASLLNAWNADTKLFIRDPKEGPQMKTEATKCCEQLFQSSLRDPSSVVVFEKNEGGAAEWYIRGPVKEGPPGHEKFVQKEFKLRELVAQADFSQIQMSEEEYKRYAELGFVFPPDAFEQRLRGR